jgi:hypothetical protein
MVDVPLQYLSEHLFNLTVICYVTQLLKKNFKVQNLLLFCFPLKFLVIQDKVFLIVE